MKRIYFHGAHTNYHYNTGYAFVESFKSLLDRFDRLSDITAHVHFVKMHPFCCSISIGAGFFERIADGDHTEDSAAAGHGISFLVKGSTGMIAAVLSLPSNFSRPVMTLPFS